MTCVREQNMDEFMDKCENAAMRCVSVIQKNYWQRTMRDTRPPYLVQLNVTRLENQHALSFDCLPPRVQCDIRSDPPKLGFPAHTKQFPDVLTDNLVVLIRKHCSRTLRYRLTQAFVQPASRLTSKKGRAKCQPQLRRFLSRR